MTNNMNTLQEDNEASAERHCSNNNGCRCCRCRCCQRRPPFGGNREATGWAIDSIATSIAFVGAGAFLLPSLIKLATDAAGCETEKPPGESTIPECNNKVHGFKPSSLISFFATVIGLFAAILMPLAGAIVDYTPHRLAIGRILAFLFYVLIFPMIFVSEDNWFEMSILFAVFAFVGLFETMALYSYLPELTNDEVTLNRFTRKFAVLAHVGMVIYLAAIVAIAAALGNANDTDTLDDEIGTARVAMSVSFLVNAILMTIAWGKLFRSRPAAHELRGGGSILTAGFKQNSRTIRDIHKNYPSLRWFYIAIMFCDAAQQGLLVIAITYMTDRLEFTGAEIGAAVLLMLIAAIPGGIVSSWFSSRFNPVRSSMVAIAIITINTAIVAAFLYKPGQTILAYVLVFIWGVGSGWKWCVDRLLFASILPEGQDSELAGVYVLFRQILTWLPPLVFTIMNERDINMRFSLLSIDIYYLLGLCSYFGIKFNAAVAAVHTDSNSEQCEDNPGATDEDDLEKQEDDSSLDNEGVES